MISFNVPDMSGGPSQGTVEGTITSIYNSAGIEMDLAAQTVAVGSSAGDRANLLRAESRMRVFVTIDAAIAILFAMFLALVTAQPTLADDIGASLAASTCAACHGPMGNSSDPKYPKLAGQKNGYLRLQLEAFRSGVRPSEIMKGFAQTLNDDQIAALARYYSRQAQSADNGANGSDTQLGARIFRSSGRGRPSCAACHATGWLGALFGGGMMGGGMMGGGMLRTNPAVTPQLKGQHAAYLVQQLDAFASGTRPSPVMGPMAASLTQSDRKAVAEYLSGLK